MSIAYFIPERIKNGILDDCIALNDYMAIRDEDHYEVEKEKFL